MKRVALFVIAIALFAGVSYAQEHFDAVDPTGRPYAIVVDEVLINGIPSVTGDEIGVFDVDLFNVEFCVGAGVVTDTQWIDPLAITAWQGEPTYQLPGFTPGNDIIFRLWDSSEGIEISAVAQYTRGDGTFGYGAYSEVTLTAAGATIEVSPLTLDFGIVPTGVERSMIVTIRNIGGLPLTIIDAVPAGEGFTLGDFIPNTIIQPDGELVLTMTFAPTAAQQYNGTLDITSNDVNHPTVTVQLTGEGRVMNDPTISADPTPLDFGEVIINRSRVTTLTISNGGAAALNVQNIVVGGANPTAFTIPTLTYPITIAWGNSVEVDVTFSPTSEMAYAANLTISSNDPVTPALVVNMTGNGILPGETEFEISTTTLNFGNVSRGAQRDMILTISNVGAGADLVISQAILTGDPVFQLPVPAPYTIGWEESLDLVVTFHPMAEGPYTGTLTLTTNDADEQTVPVTLSGNGVIGPHFNPVPLGASTYNIVVERTYMNGQPLTLETNDEIGVFDGDLCVGAGIVGEFWTGAITTTRESAPGAGDGFVDGHPIDYVIWDDSALLEYIPTAYYHVHGNGTFGADLYSSVYLMIGTLPPAALTAAPGTLNFGTVNVGQTPTRTFTISNDGGVAATLTSGTISNPAYTVAPAIAGATIPLFGSTMFTVTFTPTEETTYDGTITIVHPAGADLVVNLNGSGYIVRAEVSGVVSRLDNGNPIEGAVVTIAGTASTPTGADGHYALADIMPGTGIETTVTATGYITFTGTVDLVSGPNTRDFTLEEEIAVNEGSAATVTEYALHQNFPNPFNPTTTIRFDLVEPQVVKVTLFNLMGQEVMSLVNGPVEAGIHVITLDAKNLSSGVYFYNIECPAYTEMKKMILIK